MPRPSRGGLEMTGILTLYNPKRSKASNYKMYRCTIEPSKEMKQAHYTILMSSHFVLILNTYKKKTFKLAKLSPFHHFFTGHFYYFPTLASKSSAEFRS